MVESFMKRYNVRKNFKGITKLWICLSIILSIFYFYVYIKNRYMLIFWGDETEILIPYMMDIYEQFRNGNFVLWNHSIGFGASNFTYFYSILGSPSFYLNLLLPSKDWIPFFIPIIDAIRFFLIGTFAWLWIGKLVKSDKAKIIASIVFTFSGWAIYWLHFSYFLDAYLYLAILLYLCEEILENRKKISFTILICLSTIISPYIIYMFSWMILFYLTSRLFMKYGRVTIKLYINKFLSVFGYYILGIGLAAFAFIPAALMLVSTDRIGSGGTSLFTMLSGGDFLRIISSLFSPVINDYDYNIFSSPFLKLDNQVYTVYCYSMILFVLILPQVIRIKFKGKKPLIITTIILYGFLFIPVFYLVFNGNTSIRWSFYLIVFNVIILAIVFDNEQQIHRKTLLMTLVCIILTLCTLAIFSLKLNWTTVINEAVIKQVIPTLIIFLLIYYFSFIIKNKKVGTVILIATLCMEASFCMILRVVNGPNSLIADSETYNEYYQTVINADEVKWIKNQDQGFYRIDYADDRSFAYNYPLTKKYNGFTSYFSVYNHETRLLFENRFTDNWFLGYRPSKFLLKSLYGSKYMIQREENEFIIPHTYEFISKEGEFYIYENSIDTSLGYATNRSISSQQVKEIDKSIVDILMLNGVIVSDNNLPQVNIDNQYQLVANNLINDGFIWNKENGYLFVDYSQTNPYGIISYEFYKDGKQVKYGEYSEFGYYAIDVDIPVDEIYIYCRNQYNENEFIPFNVYWISDDTIDFLFKQINEENKFNNIRVNGEIIHAEIEITDSKKWVALNIPYNPGWQLKINNRLMDIQIVNEVFMGFELEPGTYTVDLKFTPQGLNFGLVVSGLSLFMLVIILFKDRKKSKINVIENQKKGI